MPERRKMISRKGAVGLGTVIVALVLGVPWWPLGWRGMCYWEVAAVLATVSAAAAAFAYVLLTYGLWKETAFKREGDLILRLATDYEKRRGHIEEVKQFYYECASASRDAVSLFEEEIRRVDYVGDVRARTQDYHRLHASSLFERARKLACAGFLSERIILIAFGREAIADYLKFVVPLNEAKMREKDVSGERAFYEGILNSHA